MFKTISILILMQFLIAPRLWAEENEMKYAEGYKESKADQTLAEKKLAEPKAVLPPKDLIPTNLISMGTGEFFSKFALIADKSTRTLTIWQQQKGKVEFVTAYPLDMGKTAGNKSSSGDMKTPEGIYFFDNSYTKNQIDYNEYGDRAFTLNYPNYFDHLQAKSGNGIWLHAIPPTKSLNRGSRGCLVVSNDVINQVATYIDMKTTPVIVDDKVTYLSQTDAKAMLEKNLAWLNAWKNVWESKKIGDYMDFYHPTFSSMKMSKSQWQTYKSNLAEKYKYISVKLFEPIFFQHHDHMVIRFLQQYQSDSLADFGEKTIYIQVKDNKPLIVSETWEPIANELVAKFKQEKFQREFF